MLKRGFSLMEMMVVLLIVAIVTAAAAPMLNKKAMDKASGVTPWVWTTNNSIAYNLKNEENKNVLIGRVAFPSGETKSRLYIDSVPTQVGNASQTGMPQIMLGNNSDKTIKVWVTNGGGLSLTDSSDTPENNSVTIGMGTEGKEGAVTIGASAKSGNSYTTVLGSGAEATEENSIAIGYSAAAKGSNITVIGSGSGSDDGSNNSVIVGFSARGNSSATAIGALTQATAEGATAVGSGNSTSTATLAKGVGSTAIGSGAQAGAKNTTVIGKGASAGKDATNTTIIGADASADGANSIVIGNDSEAKGHNSIALGGSAASNSIAIGVESNAGNNSIALGSKGKDIFGARATGAQSVALGQNSLAEKTNSIAIGTGAEAGSGDEAGDDNIAIGASSASGVFAISLGSSAESSGASSIALGSSATSLANYTLAIGSSSVADKVQAIALGNNASANGTSSIAIGGADAKVCTKASGSGSVALGKSANATGANSMALGPLSSATAENSVALGPGASTGAKHTNSIAIGHNATTRASNQVVLGGKDQTVTIGTDAHIDVLPFKIALENITDELNVNSEQFVVDTEAYFLGDVKFNDNVYIMIDNHLRQIQKGENYTLVYEVSDKRLKNVGEVFKGGLEEIKKLEVFNYTFKKDKDKTAHVGVMAQDLQKIFPNAVKEANDGYLRIRTEDIFYSLVNAIKELDAKIEKLITEFKKVFELEKEIIELKKQNADLQKDVIRLQKQAQDLQKQVGKLKKKSCNK